MVETEHWTAFVGFPEIPAIRFQKAKKVFQFASYVLPVSNHLLNGIEGKTGLDLSNKNRIINNAVDTKKFSFQPYTVQNEMKTILTVARLEEQKDLPNLFNAQGILKRRGVTIQVLIIGKGDPLQYQLVISENGIEDNVIFLGEKEKHFITDEMRKANLLCLSSISENSPCVIGEALCSGLPVVSTNVGGIPELLDETNGILVPPKNPKKLAAAIYEALFQRNYDREAISRQAQAQFSYQAIGKQIFTVYQKITGRECAE